MAGCPQRKLRRLRELLDRQGELASMVYDLQPERCDWEVYDEVRADDIAGQAWIACVSDVVQAHLALGDLIETLEAKQGRNQQTAGNGTPPKLSPPIIF